MAKASPCPSSWSKVYDLITGLGLVDWAGIDLLRRLLAVVQCHLLLLELLRMIKFYHFF